MTKTQKIDLVTRYINGETPEELAERFGTTVQAILYNLRNIYQPRHSGRRINPETCVHPKLANWLNANGYSGAWLAERIGVTKASMHYYLHGVVKIPRRRQLDICAVTKLLPEQLFD
mgnify:CR=1 FL=1